MMDNLSSTRSPRSGGTVSRFVLAAATVLLFIGGSGFAEDAFRHDRILVKPKANTDAGHAAVAAIHKRCNASILRHFPGIGGLQVVSVPAGANIQDTLAAYKASADVEYAEPDYIVHANVDPNDPSFLDGTQWDLKNTGQNSGTAGADVSAEAGWNVRTDASSVIVAVIDTGIRYTHQDLAPNMWHNPNPTNNDIFGINAITGTGDPMDDNGHGSHCSGTIGAAGNNGLGVSGVAWKVQLMGCKFLASNGSGSLSDAITCIDYARTHGAKIMSNSWGGGAYTQSLYDAIDRARQAGILFVVAAGNATNDNDGTPSYPASYNLDNVIAVAATNRTDGLSSFSNYGYQSVALGAPGEQITNCWASSDTAYNNISGTSMATPHVSGLFALLRAQFPNDSYLDLKYRALYSVDRIPSLLGKCKTGGRMNLAKALTSTLNHPGNDNFSAATVVSGSRVSVTGSNVGATKETSEPNHAVDPGGKSVWWKWTCQNSGPVTVSTAGSNFDTLLGVYTGGSVGALTQVAANDDVSLTDKTSSVTFTGTAGTTYAIAVDGWGFDSGAIALNITATNLAPTVSLDAPLANAQFFAPATITLSATASDTDGSVTKVEFFNGATKIGQATTPPYTFSWTNVAIGAYSLTAVATDNAGTTTTSGAAAITVVIPPPQFTTAASATPNPAVVGQTVAFAAAASNNATFAWTFGDGAVATGASVGHAFAAGGKFSAKVTATNSTGSASSSIDVVVVAAPQMVSDAAASPNPGVKGQSVTFTAAASNDTTYAWNFGDGTSGAGASATHSYSAAGTYAVKVTASNLAGSVSSTVSEVVNEPPVTGGTGSSGGTGGGAGGPPSPEDPNAAFDSNGFPTDLKALLGLPTDTAVTAPYAGKPLLLKVSKLSIKLNFAHANSDSIGLSGKLDLPSGVAFKGQSVAADIGGVPVLFTLDSKGRGKSGGASFALKFKAKKGVIPAQSAAFQLKLTHGAYAAALASSGLVNGTVAASHLQVVVTLLFNQTFLQAAQPQVYSSKQGNSGATK